MVVEDIKMVLKCPLTPSPSPASAKVSCQGANKFKKSTCLMTSYDLYEESLKSR